jgi:transposase InsO family protein
MSRRENCCDNACVESFFGTLKRDMIPHRQYRTREEAKQEIFEYLEVFIIGSAATRPSAISRQRNLKQGWHLRNPVSMELGEDQG